MTNRDGQSQEWQFDRHVSAAGWIDKDSLLIASETGFFRFDILGGDSQIVASLEADNPVTRSNDGRADPWGGFWIGTMGKQQEKQAGAIYRFFRGKIERLYRDITIPNAICFSPDKPYAYFTDTPTRRIMRQKLDGEGWPQGEPEVFVDLCVEKLNPDGAVTDSDGCLWNAQWGASRIARYSPGGEFMEAVSFPARQTTCPAFGGEGLSMLFSTSAAEGLDAPGASDGLTFVTAVKSAGVAEPAVLLE